LEDAIGRTLGALKVCAEKIGTPAMAGVPDAGFLTQIKTDTDLELETILSLEGARLTLSPATPPPPHRPPPAPKNSPPP